MGIERQAPIILPKRQKDEIMAKHERIGEYLGLNKVPIHQLAWKEARMELDGGDCYPLIDVLETMAERIHDLSVNVLKFAEKTEQAQIKKAGRPKKSN